MPLRLRHHDEFSQLSRGQRTAIEEAFVRALLAADSDIAPSRKEQKAAGGNSRAQSHIAGGFLPENNNVDIASADQNGSQSQQISLESIPLALAHLDLEDDADALDIFRQATDQHDNISKQDFLRVCALLIVGEEEGGGEREYDATSGGEHPDSESTEKRSHRGSAKSSLSKSAARLRGMTSARTEGSQSIPHKSGIPPDKAAAIDRLWLQFSTDSEGQRRQAFGADSVRAVAALIGDFKWTEADISEMVEYASNTSDKLINASAFRDLVLRTKAV